MIADIGHLDLNNLADLISVAPISFFMGTAYTSIVNVDIDSFKFLMGLLTATLSSDVLKRIPYPDALYQITRRPEGASNCDYLSKNGPASKNAPGFPSGHMTTTGFFATYIILKTELSFTELTTKQKPLIFVSVSLILAMSWARYYKKCHNITQIIGGIVWGSLVGYLWYTYV
jgi:membrane-associated phospholipid phosphatase